MFTRRDATNSTQSSQDEPQLRTPSTYSAPVQATPSTPPPATSTQSGSAGTESIIAAEDTFDGQLRTVTGVRVLGTVRGGIESERSVRIESGARVEADITADEVVIAGTYTGNLTCRNRVEIAATGHVTGKVDTEKLYLHEGGFFDGELHMKRPGEEPAPQPAAESARPRRSRYVDLGSDADRSTEENAAEVGKAEGTGS